jgi:hypothetical protein
MPWKPSASPARRTPAPLRPTRPRGSAPTSTAEAEAAMQTSRLQTQSRSSTSPRYRSRVTRSRQSSSASRPRPPSRPRHRGPQRLSRLHPPCPQPLFLRELQQRLLLRQPRLHPREPPLRPAASFLCPGKEPISSLRHQLQPSPPSLPLARLLRGLQSLRRQPIRPQRHPTPQIVPWPLPQRSLLQAPQSPPLRRLRFRSQNQ